MKKFKQFFEEKIILSAVMCVLLAVVLVTATYGWYALNNTDRAYGLDLKTGGDGGIIVATVSGGEDIMVNDRIDKIKEGDKLIAMISINLKDFDNIKEGEIAPGAWGYRPLYITSLSESIKSYEIKIQFQYNPNKDALASMTPEQLESEKKEVETMLLDHFAFYRKKEVDEEGNVIGFSERLPLYMDEKDHDKVITARGPLTMGKEETAELYWVWNYEIIDIPEFENLTRFPTYGLTSDSDDYENARRLAIRQYDEEDTKLGNYLDDIYFNIFVEGSFETYRESSPNKGYVSTPGTHIVNVPAENDAADTNAQNEDSSETEGIGEGADVDTGNNSGVDTEGGSEGVRD